MKILKLKLTDAPEILNTPMRSYKRLERYNFLCNSL